MHHTLQTVVSVQATLVAAVPQDSPCLRVSFFSAAAGGNIIISGGTLQNFNSDPLTAPVFNYSVTSARISVTGTPTFTPEEGTVYQLSFNTTPATNVPMVTGGASFLSNFALYDQPTRKLVVSGSNLNTAAN